MSSFDYPTFEFYGQDSTGRSTLKHRFSRPVHALYLKAGQHKDPSREAILEALEQIDKWKQKYSVACLFSYEMGCILQEIQQPGHLPEDYPLLVAAAYLSEQSRPEASGENQDEAFDLGPARLSISRQDYERSLQSIFESIRRGRTYQVNFTTTLEAPFSGSPAELFHSLRKRYPAPHCAYVDLGIRKFASLSPELFFSLSRSISNPRTLDKPGHILEVRPMKGTVMSSQDPEKDAALKQSLLNSDKDIAELAMITDLLRNDLGRISPFGGVRLLKAVQPESYGYVHQLTSVIQAGHVDGSLKSIIPSLFPSGSITGAPRSETMKIIAEQEAGKYRGIYTGSIGFFHGEQAEFNVAIRTAELQPGRLRYGAGGGITLSSSIESEWKEMHWKTRPLNPYLRPPGLIETMRVSSGGIRNQTYHIQRLVRSTMKLGIIPSGLQSEFREFRGKGNPAPDRSSGLPQEPRLQFPDTPQKMLTPERFFLRNTSGKLHAFFLEEIRKATPLDAGIFRLRLHLKSDGNLDIQHHVLSQQPREKANVERKSVGTCERDAHIEPANRAPDHRKTWKLKLWHEPMSSCDRLLLHKVDRRNVYDEARRRAMKDGFDEVLFFNDREEITEGSITNLFYRMDGRWYTPPVKCGLLPGIMRHRLLERFAQIGFRKLLLSELAKTEKLVMVNSLRGLQEATI